MLTALFTVECPGCDTRIQFTAPRMATPTQTHYELVRQVMWDGWRVINDQPWCPGCKP